ncbi:hypothetical protein EBR21_08345, partial [bacterium]|nr:hypothetical protein [bacterium]
MSHGNARGCGEEQFFAVLCGERFVEELVNLFKLLVCFENPSPVTGLGCQRCNVENSRQCQCSYKHV